MPTSDSALTEADPAREWQRPRVIEHLAEIVHVNPTAQAGQHMKCLASLDGGSPTRLPMYLPRGI